MFRAAASTIFLILFVVFTGLGQQISPEKHVSSDTVSIGEVFQYSLKVSYPRTMDILLPDSTYNFAPFEVESYQAFQTRSDSLTSIDSTVYNLSTYEIDSVQYIQLPVFILQNGDSIEVFPELDSLILYHTVTEIPDSISLKQNTAYNDVSLNFNYPYLIIGVTILLVSGILVFIFFGKAIRRRIRIYFLKKAHKKFIEEFGNKVVQLENNGKDDKALEFLLWKWKDYMESLNKMPYTKMTTKEIKEILPDQELNTALNEIDRAIYGRLPSGNIGTTFNYLRQVSEESFHQKIEEIKNV